MKKLFLFATVVFIFYLFFLLPTYSVHSSYIIQKYSANAREIVIIEDLYSSMKILIAITLWVLTGIYLLFAGAVLISSKKK